MNASEPSSPPFKGFPAGRTQFTRLPGAFFRELLPAVESLTELKVTLYIFWYLDQLEGSLRYFSEADLCQDERFMAGLGAEPQLQLADGLGRATARGTLLKVEVPAKDGLQAYYFLNTSRGRAALQAIQNGEWSPAGSQPQPVGLDLERPNIFKLYEEHIGPLTPMISDALRDAEKDYPYEWIKDAFRLAVESNVRRWRYIQAILRSWQEEGRDDQDRRDSAKDRQRYRQTWSGDDA